MFTANLTPIVIEPIIKNDELITDIDGILKEIEEKGAENILCIFSTTSCFAPRGYDNIIDIASICKKYNIYHVVNNAYGIYCTKIVDMLNQANKKGNIDIIISSTDKNFMVPVGGSIVYSGNDNMINKIKKNYPGRASISPIIDIFITLLNIGKNKYKALVSDRKEKYKDLKTKMIAIAENLGEKILENPNNKISIAMTLTNICKDAKDSKEITYLGSLFFSRQISGIKFVAPTDKINFNDYYFSNYGAHSDSYPFLPYCAFAAAIGITDEEIKEFTEKFVEIINIYKNKNKISVKKEKLLNKKENKKNNNNDKSNKTKFLIVNAVSFQIDNNK
jgi:O-phospho-L-seryl-tRNASec:L-selenocysteinyl-tRNA synthase